jgi:hypothetical protein
MEIISLLAGSAYIAYIFVSQAIAFENLETEMIENESDPSWILTPKFTD